MKVLLIQPPHFFDGKSRRPGFFPIGLGYLVRALMRDGHEVEVFDIWAHQLKDEDVASIIPRLKFDVVGITALSTQYRYVKWLVGLLKKDHSGCPVILGGPLPTFSADMLLNRCKVDVCVISEGDISFPNLLRNLGQLDRVNGIAYKEGKKIIFTPAQEYVKDLDSLGFASRDRDIFATDIYLDHGYLDGFPDLQAMNVATNRGCPWSCDFCSKTYRRMRSRSVPHIKQEIETLIDEFGVKAIFFNDELLVFSKKRIYELCEAIKPLNIKWVGQARVDTVDKDVLKCMKEAGCVAVGLGIESGSQRILDAMNKKTTVEQNIQGISAAKEVGLNVTVQCIYGYPGECDETLQETRNFFKRADTLHQGFFVLTPLPGTALYQRCREQGVISDEDEYLSCLDAGYNTTRRALVNLTNFDVDEFYQRKRWLEERVQWDYFVRHPFEKIIVRDENNNLLPKRLARQVLGSIWDRIIGPERAHTS